jgi:hypothetical protein
VIVKELIRDFSSVCFCFNSLSLAFKDISSWDFSDFKRVISLSFLLTSSLLFLKRLFRARASCSASFLALIALSRSAIKSSCSWSKTRGVVEDKSEELSLEPAFNCRFFQ